MTLVDSPSRGPRAGGAVSSRPGGGPDSPARPRAARTSLGRQVTSAAMITLSVTLLGFAAWLVFFSRLDYDRVQYNDYANFRTELAQATAPTGPTEPSNPKAALPPGSPVAVLRIPEIGLNAIVLEGTSGAVLEGGPGHLRDTPLPGQAGISEIFGRRAAYGGVFSRISSLRPGDTVTVVTGLGVATYRVVDIRRAGDQVPVLTAPGRLILATADGPPFAPTGVLRVDADLVSKPQPTSNPLIGPDTLPADELLMGTNPLAWVWLVLWGLPLALAACAVSWLSQRWGRWQAWVVAVPVLSFLGLAVANQVTQLLPNLM
jgi:sortase A